MFDHSREISQHESSTPGKIILLCGTSTAGKTSICHAAQNQAKKIGQNWFIDGVDLASEKIWTEPCELAGNKYLSAGNHFVKAMKEYIDPLIIDKAVKDFGARTLSVAIFSRRYLGNPKVDEVDLTPEENIQAKALKVYKELSKENQKQYSLEGIESLLIIIQKFPKLEEFFKHHSYPPQQQLNLLMLERAITRAKMGESTILDVVGNETIDDKLMVDIFHDKIKFARLPTETGLIAIAHCPISTLIDRIDERNNKAINEGRKEDLRHAFFPFNQYGDLYEKAPEQLDPTRPVIGNVTREDIKKAAEKFGKEENGKSLLVKLGFTDDEKNISVVARLKYDELFQTGSQTSQEIAEDICNKVFKNSQKNTLKN